MRRPPRIPVLLSVAVLAAGCGIRATDVVEAGDAAVVDVALGGPEGTILFFVHQDELRPVARPFMIRPEEAKAGTAPEYSRVGGSRDKALAMLFAGPDESERGAGLRTELPPLTGPAYFDLARGGGVVRMKSPVTGLSGLARQQLVCTVAEAIAPGGREPVTVEGADGSFGPERCTL